MQYGSAFATGLELEESTGDPLLDMMMSKIPKYEIRDVAFIVNLPDGKDSIPLMIKPDSYKKDFSALIEYKTSTRKWTQRDADNSDQITFYCVGFWLKTGQIPQNIELVQVQTIYDTKHALMPSGDVWRYRTKRNMQDIIKMTGRIRKIWKEINQRCELELL